MFSFSAGEIILIALIALVLFGNDKLPENMQKMIKGINQAKKLLSGVQHSWQDIKIDLQKSLDFETEKRELEQLIQPLSIDGVMVESQKSILIPVSQEDIDVYQKNFEADQAKVLNYFFEPSGLVIENNTKKYTSARDYYLSNDFCGPRI